MKILYFDCGMGAAGDMMTAALLELLPKEEQDDILDRLNCAGLEGVCAAAEREKKCGITGTRIHVTVNGAEEGSGDMHSHSGRHMHMSDIEDMVASLRLSQRVKDDIISVYKIIAEAESRVHDEEVSEVHFHEVGMKDAVMDIAAVCLLMDHISPGRVVASPVNTGSGTVRCTHGVLPVPAPATAFILQNIPIYSTGIEGELCTPTGAALLKYFVNEFAPMPLMIPERTGYGMGSRDFETANCLRAILGEAQDAVTCNMKDEVTALSCNLDDMTAEEIGFAMERLYELGAKEVYTIPAGMKKSRPGVVLNVLCSETDRGDMVHAIFEHTSTLGIRETRYSRYILDRSEEIRETALGQIRFKRATGCGVDRSKPEYEDLARLARERGCSITEIREILRKEPENT